MPFQIYVSGSSRFVFQQRGIDIGDVYDFADGLNRMTSTSAIGSRIVTRSFWQAGGEALSATPGPNSPTQTTIETLAARIGFDLLAANVTLAAVERSPLHITVATHQSGTLFPENGFAVVLLDGTTIEPARDFLRMVNPALARTGLNTFGVLASMAAAFAEFTLHRCSPDRYSMDSEGRRFYRMLFQIAR